MKKLIIGIVIVLFVLAVLLISAPESFEEESVINEKPIVKIGVSLPLTGLASFAGQPGQKSLNMAFKKWQKKDTKYNYELIIEDDKLQSRNISMIANKFMNLDKVNAILSFFGTGGKMFSSLNNMNNNPVPHISCAWGTSSTIGEYNFNNNPSVESYADLLIKQMKKENISNVSIIVQNTSEVVEMQEIIIKNLNEAGINIIENDVFNTGDMDYTNFIKKVKESPTEIIYVQLFEGFMPMFIKQMKENGLDLPLTTALLFFEIDDKRPFEGYWFVTYGGWDKDFEKEFESKAQEGINSCTLNIYDNLDILITAFENAEVIKGNIPTSESVLKYLKSMKTWNGVSGDLNFKENGQIQSDPKLAIIKDGKVELLEE